MTALHKPTAKEIYSGRKSDEKEYWHQYIECRTDITIPPPQAGNRNIAFLGYAGDEGVRRNLGRVGASEGPTSLRKIIGPMSYHLSRDVEIYDFGSIETLDADMEECHQKLQQYTFELLQKNYFPVLFGGGHDLAYPHGSAVLDFAISKGQKIGIINMDAHFDLRETIDGKGHSGSPFFQLSEKYKTEFHYLCLGIQPAANPQSLFKKAKEIQASWILASELTITNWKAVDKALEKFIARIDLIYLTVDLDGYHSGIAPGVSAPSPTGFSADIAFKILHKIAQSKKLISLDVVELNPTYDLDNATARLAARTIEHILSSLFGKTVMN